MPAGGESREEVEQCQREVSLGRKRNSASVR